jgi:hypothetical protein
MEGGKTKEGWQPEVRRETGFKGKWNGTRTLRTELDKA